MLTGIYHPHHGDTLNIADSMYNGDPQESIERVSTLLLTLNHQYDIEAYTELMEAFSTYFCSKYGTVAYFYEMCCKSDYITDYDLGTISDFIEYLTHYSTGYARHVEIQYRNAILFNLEQIRCVKPTFCVMNQNRLPLITIDESLSNIETGFLRPLFADYDLACSFVRAVTRCEYALNE